MYAIKMNTDKSLTTTIKATIYQYEKNADTLVFLIPSLYEDKNISDCEVYMHYILPNKIGKSEELEMTPEPYKDYYQYRLKVSTNFTDVSGTIELWLNIIDSHSDWVLETGSISIPIKSTKDITEYFSSEDRNQLYKMRAKIAQLEQSKADNIFYDTDDHYLQLTANGNPIGDQVDISSLGSNDNIIDFDKTSNVPKESDDQTNDVIYF